MPEHKTYTNARKSSKNASGAMSGSGLRVGKHFEIRKISRLFIDFPNKNLECEKDTEKFLVESCLGRRGRVPQNVATVPS